MRRLTEADMARHVSRHQKCFVEAFGGVEILLRQERPPAFGFAGDLAHFGISCSKRRRFPKGSVVYITFAP